MFTKKWKGMLIAVCTFALSASATAGGLLVGADAEGEGTVVAPIAKYEFLDASDLGKDSMGNWNLVKGGEGTLQKTDKGVKFDGNCGLISPSEAKDVSETLGSFTMNFTMTPEKQNRRTCPIGFGWAGWSATKYCWFTLGQGGADGRRLKSAAIQYAGRRRRNDGTRLGKGNFQYRRRGNHL